jgi:hypothetical protein
MIYICVEDKQVSAVLNYPPTVPKSVAVYKISDQEQAGIERGDLIFNPETCKVEEYHGAPALAAAKESDAASAYLASTDWRVLRHLREQVLGLTTTLSEKQYLELEALRHSASTRVQPGKYSN